jgi:hypothetical protein
VTGDPLTVLDYVVCNENDWNKVKQYYIQGTKGLLVVYNREIKQQKMDKALRNILITLVVLAISFAMMLFITSNSTLADPAQLLTRHKGEEYLRPYYQRPDVRAFIWAASGSALYYAASVLVYFLLQNLMGWGFAPTPPAAPVISRRSRADLAWTSPRFPSQVRRVGCVGGLVAHQDLRVRRDRGAARVRHRARHTRHVHVALPLHPRPPRRG